MLRRVLPLLLVIALTGCAPDPMLPAAEAADSLRVLVFSKTAGYRHESIPVGIDAIRRLGASNGFTVEATEDSSVFNDANLARFDVVVFLSTTGDILGAQEEAAFARYIGQGGSFVGVHAASDTEYEWPWYGGLVGAYFASHPPGAPEATVRVSTPRHPSTAHLPDAWVRTDEWYNFRALPQNVDVLARLDETTFEGGTMGDDHPIAWAHTYEGGRAWYTAGGHTSESYGEPLFVQHLLGGILWAAGREVPATAN